MAAKKIKLTSKQYVNAISRVAKKSFEISPSAAIISIIDSIVQAALPVATTYFAAKTTTSLVDAYAGSDEAVRQIFVYLGLTTAMTVIMLVWSSISNYVSQMSRYKIESAVEDMMLEHFTSLPFHMYDDKDVVDLHEKARRFSYYFSYIFTSMGSMMTAFSGAIIATVALVTVAWWVPVIIFLVIIPEVIVQIRLARRQAQHWDGNVTLRRRKYNMGWMLQESRYIAEMRVYGVAKHLIAMYGNLRDKDEKERLKFEGSTVWKQLASDIAQSVVELSILIWTVLEIASRAMPVGQFLFVQQLLSRAIAQASSLARQIGSIDQDLANIVDYQQFMELETQNNVGIDIEGDPKTVELKDISFVYPKTEASVLESINMSIKAGQRIAVVGENGAGKSTLIKIIVGLYHPTKGEVLIDGTPLTRINLESWHKRIALLWQDFVSYTFATIKENITLGDVSRPGDVDDIDQAATKGELKAVVDKLPHGKDTYIERWMAKDADESTATELSGGQYQRLALSRNFYRDSPIVILDEPTSAIDALAEARIFKRLFEEKNKTIIIISHRYTTIERADCIYMLENGKIVEIGTAKELKNQKGKFYEMFKEQIK